MLQFLLSSPPIAKTMIKAYVHSPESQEDADMLVEALVQNLARGQAAIRESIRDWDRKGCHYLAQALKRCYFYDHRNILGDSLRSLANTAIILEHRAATK